MDALKCHKIIKKYNFTCKNLRKDNTLIYMLSFCQTSIAKHLISILFLPIS
jgi:hypothetical protein